MDRPWYLDNYHRDCNRYWWVLFWTGNWGVETRAKGKPGQNLVRFSGRHYVVPAKCGHSFFYGINTYGWHVSGEISLITLLFL